MNSYQVGYIQTKEELLFVRSLSNNIKQPKYTNFHENVIFTCERAENAAIYQNSTGMLAGIFSLLVLYFYKHFYERFSYLHYAYL